MSNTTLTVLGGAATPGGLAGGFHLLRKRRLIQDLPTSKTAGVTMGLNEVKGEARCDNPLLSDMTATACVYAAWRVEEHYRRTETYEEDGETKTRTVEGWETVASRAVSTPFELEDDTGRLRIVPEGADITGDTALSEEGTRGHRLWHLGGGGSVSGSTGRRRFTEEVVAVGASLFVLGPARVRQDVAKPELAQAKGEPFLISTKSEEQITRGLGWGSRGLFAASAAGAGTAAGAATSSPQVALVAAAVVGVGLLVLVLLLFSVYNTLVNARDRTRKSWANVEVELQRRHDLIPNLVAVVTASAAHERSTLEAVTQLRAEHFGGAGGAHSDADVRRATTAVAGQTAALRQVLAVAERYPDLHTSGAYLDLQRQLVDTENRLALGRQFFNDSVENLRNRIGQFPGVLFSRSGRFPAGELFATDGLERAVPTVALAGGPEAAGGG